MIWALLLFLVLLAAFVLAPVWYGSTAENETSDAGEDDEYAAENLRLYQERLQELDERQDILPEDKEALRLELDREFLASEQFAGYQAGAAVDVKSRLWVPVLMLVFVAVGSLSLYSFWGAKSEITAVELLQAYSNDVNFSKENEQKLLQAMQQAALDNPNKLEWGYYYGRLSMEGGDYQQARVIFEDLLLALPADNEADRLAILNMLIQATFFDNQQQPSVEIYSLIRQSLAIEPDQTQFLGLAGMIAFELGEYRNAIEHWKALWQGLPDDPNTEVLVQGIERAAERLQEQGQEVDLGFLKRKRLMVKVAISPELKAQYPANTTVFVAAVAVDGSPMPLAAQRLTLGQLPTEVVLSDAQAVMPNMTISNFPEVTIRATLSVSGEPSAQAGDWQGTISPVKNDHEGTLELIIDKEIK